MCILEKQRETGHNPRLGVIIDPWVIINSGASNESTRKSERKRQVAKMVSIKRYIDAADPASALSRSVSRGSASGSSGRDYRRGWKEENLWKGGGKQEERCGERVEGVTYEAGGTASRREEGDGALFTLYLWQKFAQISRIRGPGSVKLWRPGRRGWTERAKGLEGVGSRLQPGVTEGGWAEAQPCSHLLMSSCHPCCSSPSPSLPFHSATLVANLALSYPPDCYPSHTR